MNTYQEEKHTRDKLVVKVALENPLSIALIPSFAEGIAKLNAINIEVEKIRTQQEQDISGVTANKKFTTDNLNHYTIDISGAVYSYADKKNDTVLKGIVNYKRGTISRMTPGEVISAANTVNNEAIKIPPDELANEGISADELRTYGEMVDYFKTISSAPRETIIERSGDTKKLVELFEQLGNLYKNTLDRLAHQFLRKDKAFYNKYQSARKVIHQGPDKPDTPPATPKA